MWASVWDVSPLNVRVPVLRARGRAETSAVSVIRPPVNVSDANGAGDKPPRPVSETEAPR